MIADLHIHTTASDGLLDPLTVAHEAKNAGLGKIAITDHDTIDGLLVLKKAGFFSPGSMSKQSLSELTIISGIELSADFPGYEVHILGYFINFDNDELKKRLKFLVDIRRQRLALIVEKVNSLGYRLDYKRVLHLAKNSAAVGRPHVAKALLEKGYFQNTGQVFETLLGIDCPAYIPKYKLPLQEVIEIIQAAEGIAVLAHPGLIGDDSVVEEVIKKTGISGIEVYHPAHDERQVKKYLSLAEKYNLKITGGSDFHGIAGRFPEKLGVFCISANLADALTAK